MDQPPIISGPPSAPIPTWTPPTAPVAPPPARHRWPLVVVASAIIVVIVGGVLVVVANRSPAAGTYHAHGVSFDYPSDWTDLGAPTFQAQAGSLVWSEGFAPQAGLDIVSVTAYQVSAAVAVTDPVQQQQLLDRAFSGLISSQNGTVTSAMHPTQLAGQPAFAVSFTLPEASGDVFTDDTIRIDGSTEYLITCQYHDATKAQISPGCQQVLSSFSTG
jgi:hypothetical protein